jgi:hypothetical protein
MFYLHDQEAAGARNIPKCALQQNQKDKTMDMRQMQSMSASPEVGIQLDHIGYACLVPSGALR